MNCIYRIVWNAATGKWVVASELAQGRRRRAGAGIAAVLLAIVAPNVLASDIQQVLCSAPHEPQEAACQDPAALRGALPLAATDDSLLVVNIGSNALPPASTAST